MDAARTIETAIARWLKPRGYRKRGRNWSRTTSADEYQVVNLQRSSWGDGDCYLNLGWHASVPAGGFLPSNDCVVTMRAEHADVIPSIEWIRPDNVTTVELPGIALLDTDMNGVLSAAALSAEITAVIVSPVADLLDRTPSVVDLVPLLTAKPWFATLALREELSRRGYELPTSW